MKLFECHITCSDLDKGTGKCTCDHLYTMRLRDPEGCEFYVPPADPLPKHQKIAKDRMYRAVQEHCHEKGLPFEAVMNKWLRNKYDLLNEAERKMSV